MYVYRFFEAIGNFVKKLKFTYVEDEINTDCTFGSTNFFPSLFNLIGIVSVNKKWHALFSTSNYVSI